MIQPEEKFELIVIGAGILGLSHAYHAAKLGYRVLLLEKDSYPVGATVRNFGQIVPSGMSPDWFEYGVESTNLYKAIQAEYDISIRENGSLYIASCEEEQRLLHELFDIMQGRGYPTQLFSQYQCLERWPSLNSNYCKQGLFFPSEVSAEPNLLIHRLLRYVPGKFSNLTYRPNSLVTRCDIQDKEVVLVTSDGVRYGGRKVIICCGNEFKILFPEHFSESGIVVSKLQMLRTQPMPQVRLEGNILTGLTIRRYESFRACPSYGTTVAPEELKELLHWGIHLLFKKAPDGTIIIGDSHEYASASEATNLNYEINQHINRLILTEAAKIVNFDAALIQNTWAGFYSQHPEKGIVEIDLENKIHIRTAIGGKGMTGSAGYAKESIKRISQSIE